MALHIDRQTKKAAAFPPEIAAIADARIALDTALTWAAPHSTPLKI
jgi:hypothetical protein